MGFSSWLRKNSEHYLVIAAQEQVAKRHGIAGPKRRGGLAETFWLSAFAPLYRALPWSLRRKVIQSLPGSHKRDWTFPTDATGPAIE